MGFHRGKGPAGPVHAVRQTGQPGPRFNYELFNCNNFNIRYWSWNYRGCWPIQIPEQLHHCSPLSSRDGAGTVGVLSHGHGTYLKPPLPRQPTPLRALRGPHSGAPLGISMGVICAGSFPRSRLSCRHPPSDCGCSTSVKSTYFWRQQGLRSTRLALQLFLVKGFKLYSFQLQDPKEP